MWLAATLLDSAGLKQAANSPVVSSAGGPAFPTPHRARERQGAAAPAGTGGRPGATAGDIAVWGPKAALSEWLKTAVYFPLTDLRHPYSLVYIINALCETCFVN